MTFTDTLITKGYVFDEETLWNGSYVKHDDDECVFHCYQQDEEEGFWNYVKMSDGIFDVISEITFNPNNGWEIQ